MCTIINWYLYFHFSLQYLRYEIITPYPIQYHAPYKVILHTRQLGKRCLRFHLYSCPGLLGVADILLSSSWLCKYSNITILWGDLAFNNMTITPPLLSVPLLLSRETTARIASECCLIHWGPGLTVSLLCLWTSSFTSLHVIQSLTGYWFIHKNKLFILHMYLTTVNECVIVL